MAELQLECDFGLFSFEDVRTLLRNPPSDPEELRFRFYNPRIWHALHGLLVAAANISKILWPDQPYAARGERLRQELDVSDASPLYSRSLRNHFEHIDERIEKWTGPRIDLNIGPEQGFGVDSRKMFRHFDPVTGVVLFAGERFELGPVTEAIRDLQQRLRELEL
jgi:hypothetical protein